MNLIFSYTLSLFYCYYKYKRARTFLPEWVISWYYPVKRKRYLLCKRYLFHVLFPLRFVFRQLQFGCKASLVIVFAWLLLRTTAVVLISPLHIKIYPPSLWDNGYIWWAGVDSDHRSQVTTDLQSVPFGRSGTYPYMELAIGIEPTTCWLQVSCSANWATPAKF